ncbi:MAG: hypothetical protein K0U41_02355 [Gammaproteobacteria bacterium]|nr:hypothetical protein [Gammaproteobacteria bacterium]
MKKVRLMHGPADGAVIEVPDNLEVVDIPWPENTNIVSFKTGMCNAKVKICHYYVHELIVERVTFYIGTQSSAFSAVDCFVDLFERYSANE